MGVYLLQGCYKDITRLLQGTRPGIRHTNAPASQPALAPAHNFVVGNIPSAHPTPPARGAHQGAIRGSRSISSSISAIVDSTSDLPWGQGEAGRGGGGESKSVCVCVCV